jgi:tetratricopeptide (TPR) repeat protein/tRNA A-37 threonylcarbamoyl transferase component Bud32
MRKMKAVLPLIVVIFLLSALAADSNDIAKLENRLAAAQGKDKLPLLVQLSNAYLSKDPKKALEYGKKSLELLEHFQDKKSELEVLDRLCQAYLYLGDFAQALVYGEKSLDLAGKINYRKGVGVALNIIAVIYNEKGDYSKSRGYSFQAFDIFREIGEKKAMASALNNIGISFDMQGNYEKALDYYLKSLKIKEDIGDKELIARSLNNIGVILSILGKNQEALEYYSRALRLKEEQGDRVGIATQYNNIGNIYEVLKDYPRALDYYRKSLAIHQELDNPSGKASALFNIGLLEVRSGNYRRALDYFQQALALREQIGEKDRIAQSLIELGKVYHQLGRYDQAVRTIARGLDLAGEIEAQAYLQDGSLALSATYEAQQDYARALKYYKDYKNAADKIFNTESSKKIAELQSRFEADKQEQEILLLKKNNEIQQLNLDRQKILRNVMIAAFILVIAAALFLVHKYRYIFTFWKKKNYIGHYRIIEQMGKGGMGTVYRTADIVDASHKKTIAVKVLREEYFSDETQKKRFKQEASIIDQVVHPNIVRVIERGETEGGLYIAMEVLEGPTLAEFLQEKKKPDIPLALNIMAQIVDALKSIHAMNIIHRDLKPENIKLVEKDGNLYFVKLMDFGLAITQHMSRFTETGMVVGTISYLSPEQVAGEAITIASDIHSLGVIFYEMLAGVKPFIGETTLDVMKQILDTEPIEISKFRPDLDRSLADLVMFMLKKDPGLRPAAPMIYTVLKNLESHV